MLSVEEMRPRMGRHGRYVVLYTNADVAICSSEDQAHQLCLYEPFLMTGTINPFHGGTYLKLLNAEPFKGRDFREVIV
jgi:hypothetical protein